MQHPSALRLPDVALLVIDMQEAFRVQMADFTETAERIATVVKGAALLNVPVIVTEQYPKGLGHTATEIIDVLPASAQKIEKTRFSACGVQAFETQLDRTNAKQVVVCGIEAHICVNQTVQDLLGRGIQVHVLADCVTSRWANNRLIALARMQQSGAIPSSVEMCLFEFLRDSKHEQFRAVQALIK